MGDLHRLFVQRTALRDEQCVAIASAARDSGAIALHIFGSLGRGTADALSDVDVWLTSPDTAINGAVRDRLELYSKVGDILLAHEMAPNTVHQGASPRSCSMGLLPGRFRLTGTWAPQSVSRVNPEARLVFAETAMTVGDFPTDHEAIQAVSLTEQVTWPRAHFLSPLRQLSAVIPRIF